MPPLPPAKPIFFGSFCVTSQVFYLTRHSFCLVNLKPIVPGHVLVSPIRRVARLRDLTQGEVTDLFTTVQQVGSVVERAYAATGLNIALQDGEAAGQSVPHVHVHLLPRVEKDFEPSDQIYELLEGEEGDVGGHLAQQEGGVGRTRNKLDVPNDQERQPRTREEMEREARWLSEKMGQDGDNTSNM